MPTFNANEMFRMAEQMERNGSAFYARAAELAEHPDVREALSDLATWELQHEKTFYEMRNMLSPDEKAQIPGDPQSSELARCYADGKVFKLDVDPAKLADQLGTLEDILEQAISMEKDSIIFYLGVRRFVPLDRGGDRIQAIIEEEMSHIVRLSDILIAIEGQ